MTAHQPRLSEAPPRPAPFMSPGDHVVCMGAAVLATIRVEPDPNMAMYREVLERALSTSCGGHETVEILRKKLDVVLRLPRDVIARVELEVAVHNWLRWRLACAVEMEAAQ